MTDLSSERPNDLPLSRLRVGKASYIVVYKLLKDKVPYTHTTAQEEAARFRDREIAYLRRKAAKLGLTLTEPEVSLVS